MPRLVAFLCALVVLATACAPAPYIAPTINLTATGRADSIAIASLAHSLVRNARGDSARAARIYDWVAHNVSYDVDGYYAGRLSDVSPEYVYRHRVAVCGGFVTLFDRMAREVGLTVAPVLGFAKGFTYNRGQSTSKPNHSWTAVRIDGNWRLVDPTWGAGTVLARRFQPGFSWDYFLADPNALILSHYPKDDRWQLLPQPVRRADFERMPLVPRVVMNAFRPDVIRAAMLKSGVRDFPLVGLRDNHARVVSAPVSGTLERGSRVAVDIFWPEATDVAVVSGKAWTHLKRFGDHFRGEAPAVASTVAVVGKARSAGSFETLLQYEVR